MKANLEIQFVDINGIKVDETLLKNVPQLFQSTQKTTEILCEQIKKFFSDHKITVKTEFKLKR